MFQFNNKKYDFWEIYNCIKRFYPIGVIKDETKMYFSYPGLKELEAILIEKIHDADAFAQWELFTKEIEADLEKEVIGTTYGQAPSFSSFILLDKFSYENFTRTKELHFFVSVTGPFYTVIGQDKSNVKYGDYNYESATYLTISPENEYADSFTYLCEKIEKHFEGFRFVPFEICEQTIEGLSVRYVNENLNTIFNALFNDHIDLKLMTCGNRLHKYDDWIKEGYVDDGSRWSIYPAGLFS